MELTLLLKRVLVSLCKIHFKNGLERPQKDLKFQKYFYTLMNLIAMFLFVCYICLADPSLNIILHRWNFSFNDVNYFSNIKKIFLFGNFLLFFRITKYLYRSGISLGTMHYETRMKLLKYKIGKSNLINFFPE
jgi:hypothetical protein